MNPEQKEKKSFKETLNLPHTHFPIRPQSAKEDPEMLAFWESSQFYEKTFTKNRGSKKFILHDGPPYANGHLHLGHAFNKILKDIICKYKRMIGFHVPFKPGFDCHGLPIELNVSKTNPDISRKDLIKKCRENAENWIDIQKKEFKNMGICADFDHPYKTMDFDYEATTISAFGNLVHDGYIERKQKTVPWCASCQTVLASAEIEYDNKKDHSLYVMFEVEPESAAKLYQTDKSLFVVIWTTTPWTLPLNQAVIAKPEAEYTILEIENNYYIIGSSRVQELLKLKGADQKIVKTLVSTQFINHAIRVINPVMQKIVPVILDQSVDLSGGTAFVHCAPGAGPEDYEIGIKNKLSVFSPIEQDGKFTHDVPIKELVGLSIKEANTYILSMIEKNGRLFFLGSITHSFPHCWRCRSPLLFRATKQWFCDLSHNDLKTRAILAIKKLDMLPESSKNRFLGTIEGRLEWCLSRQRTWGTPIPALICNNCDFVYTNKEFINFVADKVFAEGIEYWETVDINAIPASVYPCDQCGLKAWKKEKDILDVWFDSGVSSFVVLKQNPDLQYPADVYVEGKDQHRGWFQSSLLLSLALSNEKESACMKSIVTHGFTVDQYGHKMSKSRGNVISPDEMIDRLSRDGLRLWVASVDYANDAVVSETVFIAVTEVFRKIRNTCRFLLANIYDFDYKKDHIQIPSLTLIDQYAIQDMLQTYYEIILAYEAYDFTRVFRLLSDFCATTLSSLYLDVIKDRLYVEKNDGYLRRSAQTVCFILLDTLTKTIAPIMSFTAEKIREQYQTKDSLSIHLQDLPTLKDIALQSLGKKVSVNAVLSSLEHIHTLSDMMPYIPNIIRLLQSHDELDFLKKLRSEILRQIEIERERGIIKHSLEAAVGIKIVLQEMQEQERKMWLQVVEMAASEENVLRFFKEFLIVSDCFFSTNLVPLQPIGINGIYVVIQRAGGKKCPRCWNWSSFSYDDDLCHRCADILGLIKR